MVLKRLTFISSDRRVILALGAIFCLGLFLRLYRLDDFTGWQDSARDFMVGERLWQVPPSSGFIVPLAAGASGYLNNSPIYYQLIAGLRILFPHPILLAGVVAALGSLAVVFNFLLGKRLGGDGAGLIAAFFTSISFVLIVQSNSVVQPNFLPAFVGLFLLSLVLAYERKSFYWALVAIMVFWWFFHLHYSIILVAPVLVLGLTWVVWRLRDTAWFRLKLGYLLVVFLLGGFFWYALTNSFSDFDLVSFLRAEALKTGAAALPFDLIKRLPNIYELYLQYYFWFIKDQWAALILVTTFGLLSFDLWLKKSRHQGIYLESLLLAIFLSMSWLVFFSRTIFDSYFVIFFTLTPLLLTQIIWLVAKWRPILGLALVAWLATWLNTGNERLAWPMSGPYEKSRLVAEAILADARGRNVNDLKQFFVASKNRNIPTYHWSSPKYWYFLEKLSGQTNADVVNGFNNLMWMSREPEFFYLICEEFEGLEQNQVREECLLPYLDKYGFLFQNNGRRLSYDSSPEAIFVLPVKPEAIVGYYWPFPYTPRKSIAQ